MRPLFGKYDFYVDEMIHVLLSSSVALIGLWLGLTPTQTIILWLSATMIDLDHLLNPVIAWFAGIPHHVFYGRSGYTIKMMHGFDIAILISALTYLLSSDPIFSALLCSNLMLHELWDFGVYPHSWKELLLLTRMASGFRPGQRNTFKSAFFGLDSLRF